MDTIEAEVPEGVELYEIDDHARHRQLIYDDVLSKFKSAFPVSHNGVRMDVADLAYEDPERYTLKQQQEAKQQDKFLGRRLRGTVSLTDEASGKVLDQGRVSLMRVPYLTDGRGSFIHGGSDYLPISQQRLLPGVYTRRKNSGELESLFNIKRGTGGSFRVLLEPETAQYKLSVRQANLHLYSLLKDIGVDDKELEKSWGPEMLDLNRAGYSAKALDSAFERLVPYRIKSGLQADEQGNYSREEKARGVKEALNAAMVSSRVAMKNLPGLVARKQARYAQLDGPLMSALQKTCVAGALVKASAAGYSEDRDDLGDDFISVGPAGLVEAAGKLVRVNRGEEELDDRESQQFKRVYRTHRLLSERVALDAGKLRQKLMWRVAKTRKVKSLPPFYFDPYMTGHIVGTALSSAVEETNPMQLADQHRRMTLMGQGGIGSESAITEDAQAVHPSIFGFISPSEGPESSRAGVDTRMASGTRIGSNGRLYQQFYDRRSKKMRWMSPEDLDGLVVKLPD